MVSGCVERRPMMVSTTMGKNEIAKAMRILDVTPVPSHTINTGAIAAFGIVWNATSSG
jgi:hypothetical protein